MKYKEKLWLPSLITKGFNLGLTSCINQDAFYIIFFSYIFIDFMYNLLMSHLLHFYVILSFFHAYCCPTSVTFLIILTGTCIDLLIYIIFFL